MYTIEDIAIKKEEGKLAPTSEKCKWNNPRKRPLSPLKVHKIKFRRRIGTDEAEETDHKLSGGEKPSMNLKTDVNRFRERLLKQGSTAGWLRNFGAKETNCEEFPVIHNIVFSYSCCQSV